MPNSTLADRLIIFSKVKVKKDAVKVPKLRVKPKVRAQKIKDNGVSIPSIVNMLLKAAVEKAKKEKKKSVVQEGKSYKLLKDEKDFSGGYGSVSKAYGTSPGVSYANYEKLFSYLGSFRAKQPYENTADHLGAMNKAADSSSFSLVDSETLQKGGWFVKYCAHPGRFDIYTALGSLVSPTASMNSSEWEKFKLLMMMDKAMYALKISTS